MRDWQYVSSLHYSLSQVEWLSSKVPLDYAHPDGPSASIAVIKVPAKFSQFDERYRGPILFNPGGPGGSGVGMLVSSGELFQSILGDEYDIVSFDPR